MLSLSRQMDCCCCCFFSSPFCTLFHPKKEDTHNNKRKRKWFKRKSWMSFDCHCIARREEGRERKMMKNRNWHLTEAWSVSRYFCCCCLIWMRNFILRENYWVWCDDRWKVVVVGCWLVVKWELIWSCETERFEEKHFFRHWSLKKA